MTDREFKYRWGTRPLRRKNTKTDPATVAKIKRELLDNEWSMEFCSQLALKYGVTGVMIRNIRSGHSWELVTPAESLDGD